MQSPGALALALTGAAIPSALIGRYTAAVPEALGCCISEEDEFLREAAHSGFRRLERLVRHLVRSQQKKRGCEPEAEPEAEQEGEPDEQASDAEDSWYLREGGLLALGLHVTGSTVAHLLRACLSCLRNATCRRRPAAGREGTRRRGGGVLA